MKRKLDIPPPMAPRAHAYAPRQGVSWRRGIAAVLVLGGALWWWWPASPQPLSKMVAEAPVQQARQAGQAWPFGGGAPDLENAEAASEASPWDRLHSASEDENSPEDSASDPRLQNAAINPARLSVHQLQAAQALLDHVVLQPEPRGGFLVNAVLPGSLYARADLRPGDAIYSLDVPGQAIVDENNMVALTSVHEMTFEVVRAGALVRLSVRLNEDTPGDGSS